MAAILESRVGFKKIARNAKSKFWLECKIETLLNVQNSGEMNLKWKNLTKKLISQLLFNIFEFWFHNLNTQPCITFEDPIGASKTLWGAITFWQKSPVFWNFQIQCIYIIDIMVINPQFLATKFRQLLPEIWYTVPKLGNI